MTVSAGAAAQAAAVLWLLVFLAGPVACGRKGPVRPPEDVVPATIADLVAASTGSGIELAWGRPERYADGSRMRDLAGFVIHRAAGEGQFAPLAVVEVTDSARFRQAKRFRFVDAGVERGTRYRYRIASRTVDGYASDPSLPAEIVYEPPVPDGAPAPAEP